MDLDAPIIESQTAVCRFQAAASAAPRSAHAPSDCLIRSAIAIPTPSNIPAMQCVSHPSPALNIQFFELTLRSQMQRSSELLSLQPVHQRRLIHIDKHHKSMAHSLLPASV